MGSGQCRVRTFPCPLLVVVVSVSLCPPPPPPPPPLISLALPTPSVETTRLPPAQPTHSSYFNITDTRIGAYVNADPLDEKQWLTMTVDMYV